MDRALIGVLHIDRHKPDLENSLENPSPVQLLTAGITITLKAARRERHRQHRQAHGQTPVTEWWQAPILGYCCPMLAQVS
jgi:hypothetical protein